MVNLHPVGYWTDERFPNDSVDIEHFRFTVTVQFDTLVTVMSFCVPQILHLTFTVIVKTSHATVVADFIKPFILFNRAKCFNYCFHTAKIKLIFCPAKGIMTV